LGSLYDYLKPPGSPEIIAAAGSPHLSRSFPQRRKSIDMEEIKTQPTTHFTNWSKILMLTGIALLLILAILFVYQNSKDGKTGPALTVPQNISEAELEERHGLQVRLIGVTAGGGMIDFRLKISDPDKARSYLQDPTHLPIILVAEDGTRLLAADEMDKDIVWEDGGILFMLLGNSGGAIQPGQPVIIEFGDLQLDPILTQ
jgi:hypothetical protein